MHRRAAIATLLGSLAAAGKPTRFLIIVGPTNHAPGTHEVAAGGRVLQHLIQQLPNAHADIVYEWPRDKALRDQADCVVCIGDTFPANRLPDPERNLADLSQMMDRGCGLACVHYATGLWGQDVGPDGEHPLLRWLGGYFANRSCPHHESFARIFPAATIEPNGNHPVTRGWKPFTIHEEPYFNNYFSPNGNTLAPNVTAFATSMLPPGKPKREVVSWGIERPDGGRGFAIVMPHFYRNWRNNDLRKCVMNGIAWSARRDVPTNGIDTAIPPLEQFQPAAMEPKS